MDRHTQTYLGALARACGAYPPNVKRAASGAPSVFGDLSWGDSLAKAAPDAAASHSLGQGVANLGSGLWNFAKNQGRDMTYGPVVDAYHHSTAGTNFALAGDYGNAARSYANAGIDTLSAGINGAFALGAPETLGADEVVGQPLKRGLVYGLRRLVGGAAAPLIGVAARPGLSAGVRTLAQPVLGAAERLGAGGVADTARAVGSSASGWLERSAGTAGAQLLGGQIPRQWAGLSKVVPSWLSNAATPVLHWGSMSEMGRLQNGLDEGIANSQARKFFTSMNPAQLQGYLSENYGAENLQKNMKTLRARGLL